MQRVGNLSRILLAACALVFAFGLNRAMAASGPSAAPATFVRASMANLPLYFTQNAGQWDNRVRFKARGTAGELFLADDHLALAVPMDRNTARVLRLRPLGARAGVTPRAGRPGGANMHFYQGNDPAKWRTGLASFLDVVYDALYPGIDLRCHGDNKLLEYDFVVAPGADPGRIRVRLEGASAVRLDADGAMVVTLPGGRELRQAAPTLYQEQGGVRVPVAGAFRLEKAGKVPVFGFKVAAYDKSKTLTIDPTLAYSTFLGGALNDYVSGVAAYGAEPDVHAIVVGTTYSSNFPDAAVATRLQGDIFVASMSADGTSLDFSLVYGGKYIDEAKAVAVNATRIYVTGYTKSPDFPTASPLRASLSGTGEDAFVLGLDSTTLASPTLLFSTYFGGSGADIGNAIALDTSGNVYVAGSTASTDLPVQNALYATNAGATDGFLLKLNGAGNSIFYATYFGGEKDDVINGLAVQGGGDAIIGGSTLSAKLPVKNAIQSASGSISAADGFIARINPTCDELVFSTYLGGDGADGLKALALDASGNIVVTGSTASTNFPKKNALYTSLAGSTDAVLTLLDVSGRFLRFSTYLGGSGADVGLGVAVDQGSDGGLQYIYVAGSTASNDFPTTNAWTVTTSAGVDQNGYGARGSGDGFVAKFEPHGARLVYSSYLGGPGVDAVGAVATASGDTRVVIVAGQTAPSMSIADTANTLFPVTPGARQTTRGGLADGFVTRMTDTGYATDVPNLSLDFLNGSPITGTTLDMNLIYSDATTASNIGAVSTTLGYDPSVLEVMNVALNAGAAFANFSLSWQDNANGALRIMVYQGVGAAALPLPTGTLATVTFRVKFSGGSVVSQVTNTPTASDTSDVPVLINGYAGQVALIQRCSLLGDCDCSGTVQLWEAQQAMRKWLGQIPQDSCVMADYTAMTATDLQQIINSHLYRTASAGVAPAGVCPASAATTGAGLLAGPVSEVDGAVSVPLRLSGGGGLISTLAVDIAYDGTRFASVQATAGAAAIAAGKTAMAYVREPGKLRVALADFAGRQTMADGEVVRLVLTPTAGASGPRGKLQITATAATPEATAVLVNPATFSLSPMALGPAIQLLLPR